MSSPTTCATSVIAGVRRRSARRLSAEVVTPMDSTKKQARMAGALYLLVAITAPLGLMVVPAKLFDASNAALTAERIRGAETLLRMGMASEFFHQAVEVFLVMALYQLFQP